MQVAGIIGRMFEELDSFEQPSTIVVDVIGIGSGVVDRMAELGLPVIGIKVVSVDLNGGLTLQQRYRIYQTCRIERLDDVIHKSLHIIRGQLVQTCPPHISNR